MIVRTEVVGSEVDNVCRAVVVLPRSSHGKQLEITRAKLPRLPFRFARTAQVMVDGLTLGLPDTYSLTHLASVMSGLKNAIGATVMDCYYANDEFEICVNANDVTLQADLAGIFNFPVLLVAGECYLNTVEEEVLRESDYYRIVVEGVAVNGHYESSGYTQTVEEYRPADGLSGVPFETQRDTTNFRLLTQVVKKDATVVDLVLGDTETACYWVKLT